MKNFIPPAASALFLMAAAFAVPVALAQEKPVALKAGPGLDIVQNNCAGCHSLDYVRINAPFLNKKGWTAEVNKMVMAYGAPIAQADVGPIVDYLAANYGAPAGG
jgi:mono/diheme cytochrome c family protein